ncbi:hypothetical protein LSTR_LSTR003238 [Laodelphax striatellus]|uniref:Uncharacterized protein n=1 Tax=Laodelphax striatellus TaxID=195883 RepID=A0A482XTV4_LAOST|nr:hypothetical protein LSTR_LSTR003238 [Laodelphax striatellus]
MTSSVTFLVVVSLVFFLISVTNCARILAIFPIPAKSHYITFEQLAFELAKRGHELVIVSYYPYQDPVKNVTVISTRDQMPSLISGIDVVLLEQGPIPKGTFFEVLVLYRLIDESTKFFEFPGVQNLLRSDEKFDLLIVEVFNTDMFAGFADKFKCPVVGFTSSTIMTGSDARFANPDNPSYIPCISSEFVAPFTFWERLSNAFQTFYTSAVYRFVYTPKSDKLAREFFGESMPPLQSLIDNYSLLLFNGHHSLTGSRPLLPNVVEIGGIHIKPAQPLPKLKVLANRAEFFNRKLLIQCSAYNVLSVIVIFYFEWIFIILGMILSCWCQVVFEILGVFPFSAKSHYMMYEPLLLELAKRGHQVTSINAFPQNHKVANFTDITTLGYVPKLVEDLDFGKYDKLPRTIFVKLRFIAQGLNDTMKIYDVPDVNRLLHSKETPSFDLVIIELFNNDLHLGLAEKLRCPFLSISPCPLMPWANSRLANPDNPSYIPHALSEFSTKMDFIQRLSNTITLLVSIVAYQLRYDQETQQMADKTFPGQDPLWQLEEKTSLILVNTHLSLHGARPLVPGVIEVGGIHVKPAYSLPQDLQTFIDGAEHGVIYFCMGSMLKASTIPDDKRDALVKVFSRLPQRVLWKWENDTMPGKSDNVKIAKWMPQRDILAHPNVKLFISHGGLLGTTEAVHCGVPIIGIPFYGDQAGNIEAVASHGAGLRLDYNDINEHNLYNKITEILNNPQYAENAKALSVRFRDRPQTPLETAVYWTEYVIRHKGAPHLRSAAVELSWYQYLLLDVIAFVLLVSLTTILSFYYSLKFIIRKLFKKSEPTNKSSKKDQLIYVHSLKYSIYFTLRLL